MCPLSWAVLCYPGCEIGNTLSSKWCNVSLKNIHYFPFLCSFPVFTVLCCIALCTDAHNGKNATTEEGRELNRPGSSTLFLFLKVRLLKKRKTKKSNRIKLYFAFAAKPHPNSKHGHISYCPNYKGLLSNQFLCVRKAFLLVNKDG